MPGTLLLIEYNKLPSPVNRIAMRVGDMQYHQLEVVSNSSS